MRLSIARLSPEQSGSATRSLDAAWFFGAARRTAATVLATIVVFATIGIVFSTQPARADTTFAKGQVFVSVGFGEVDVYDPASGNQLNALVDSTGSQYTAGTAFDANGDLFVADGTTGNISEFSPTGAPMGVFASGLSNPAALVFDQAGNLYVGQVRSKYIAEFSPSGQRMLDIGPLKSQLYGDDWIDLSSDQCTFYYTSERNAVMSYNMCTNPANPQPQQLPDFTQQPLAGPAAYELRILPNGGTDAGDVLVADSDRVVLLDNQGNVSQTYLCSSLPGCAGQLYGLALDPNGTSFWVSDPFSGLVWQVDIATGNVEQIIDSQAAYLYGLSVAGEVTAAATVASSVPQTTTTTTIQPLTSPLQYGTPTQVSAVVTSTTNGVTTPLADSPVVFTLSGGNETCTGTTDSTGTATCVITPTEPAFGYTLTATFNGVQSQTNPVGTSTQTVPEAVGSEQPTVSYTGPTTGVNGQPITLTGTLTTPAGDTSLPPGQPVSFTVGSGPTAQTCTGTTIDASGDISPCSITLNQPVSSVTITTSYSGVPPYIASSTSTTNATVTEPTTLTVHSTGGDYGDVTAVSATLTDASSNPLANQSVTLSMNANSSESCTATTNAAGLASCSITPLELSGQGNYPLTASFAGRPDLPLQLTGSTGSGTFEQKLEETQLTYTGGTVAQNGQPLVVSGVLTSEGPSDNDGDAATSSPIAGRTVTFVLGSGAGAQTCQAQTDPTGTAQCSIASVNQAPGPIPVSDTFGGDVYYLTASASSTVNLPEGTQLSISNPTPNTYNGQSTLTGTLTNTYSGQLVNGEPVTLTINGTQSCTAITGANGSPNGVASCTLSPNEPAGTYSFTGSFPGSPTSMPQLLSSGSTSTIVVTPAPTTLTYNGTNSVTNGQPATFSGTVTSSNPSSGTDVSGVPVTFTIGSGNSLQSCSGTSNASGYVSCTIPNVTQTSSGTVGINGLFPGNNYYGSSTVSSSAAVHTPTTLIVSDTSSAPPTYGAPTTLTGTLTTYAGVPVANEPVTLTLNGTESCTATTNANGVASCTVTPSEPGGSYTLSGKFGGGQSSTLSQPALNPSGGSNTVMITKAPTTSTYSSPSIVVNGLSATLSGTVSTSLGSGLTGQTAKLTVGSGSSAQSCTGTITASGSVSCTIPGLNQISGSLPVTVSYGGNSYYGSSSSSSTVIVASAPSAGGFVVGDLSAGTPPSTMPSGIVSGNTVNFWGSQYWKNNSFSGVANAPASMKGYIDNGASDESIPVLQSTACGKQWLTDPGNSSHPPATIPTYMLVIVSSNENKLGSQEYGNLTHILVVQVSAGYGPAPGHDGWGKIVGWLC